MTIGDRIPATRRPGNDHPASNPGSAGPATPRADPDSGHSRVIETPRVPAGGPHPAAPSARSDRPIPSPPSRSATWSWS